MRPVHPDEPVDGRDQPPALVGGAESRVARELKQLGGERAPRPMLLAQDFHELDLLTCFFETREEVILLEFLVVVLDEGADDGRALREQARLEIRLRP